jgi:hypothetical protein
MISHSSRNCVSMRFEVLALYFSLCTSCLLGLIDIFMWCFNALWKIVRTNLLPLFYSD